MPEKSKTLYQSEVERLYGKTLFRPEQYARVRQSKAYMEQHYAQTIKLDELANSAHMSRFHYTRVFQRMYGLTPRIYLRDLRIAKAKELLKSGLTITQVCFNVGYESLPSFSTAFKKCTGNSPKKYQQLHNSKLE